MKPIMHLNNCVAIVFERGNAMKAEILRQILKIVLFVTDIRAFRRILNLKNTVYDAKYSLCGKCV